MADPIPWQLWTKEQRAACEEWVASRPDAIREVAERISPEFCYRIEGKPNGHYVPTQFDEMEDGRITVQMIHGADSFLAGSQVFGIDPDKVKMCGCGKWRHATEEETAAADANVSMFRANLQ